MIRSLHLTLFLTAALFGLLAQAIARYWDAATMGSTKRVFRLGHLLAMAPVSQRNQRLANAYLTRQSPSKQEIARLIFVAVDCKIGLKNYRHTILYACCLYDA